MSDIVKYQSMTGAEIELSPQIIKQYLVSGDASKVTDQEIMMFLSLCKFQKLNPFLREAYLIKYGNGPATMVTGKETFLKRAVKNPRYRGHQTGIILEADKPRDAMMAWAEVYVEGYKVPVRCEVDYMEYVGMKDEYVKSKATGRKVPNRMWAEKPRTMLKKVALVQALREAFPEDFGGMYSPEEINTIQDDALPAKHVEVEVMPIEEIKQVTGRQIKEDKKILEEVPITPKKKELTDWQKKILEILTATCNGDKEEMKAMLHSLTEWEQVAETEDGTQVRETMAGKTSLYDCNDALCEVAYEKLMAMDKAL